MDRAVKYSAKDGWKDNEMKERAVVNAVKKQLQGTDYDLKKIMALVKANADE